MLRAQLEERKKAILQRINQEGKEKLEKVFSLNFYPSSSFSPPPPPLYNYSPNKVSRV